VNESSRTERASRPTIEKTQDVVSILRNILGVVFFGWLTNFAIEDGWTPLFYQAPITLDSIMYAVFCGLCVYNVLRLRVQLGGYILDTSNDTFSFPGGGRVANSVLDVINPVQWFNRVLRFKVTLSDIHMIEQRRDVSSSVYEAKRYWSTVDKLYITGPFGAFDLTIGDKGKRRQIFDRIRFHNKMGDPVNLNK
jgi:hypothetical protein